MDWAMVWPAQPCRSPAVGTVGLVGRCAVHARGADRRRISRRDWRAGAAVTAAIRARTLSCQSQPSSD
jgi:hypothetical protein